MYSTVLYHTVSVLDHQPRSSCLVAVPNGNSPFRMPLSPLTTFRSLSVVLREVSCGDRNIAKSRHLHLAWQSEGLKSKFQLFSHAPNFDLYMTSQVYLLKDTQYCSLSGGKIVEMAPSRDRDLQSAQPARSIDILNECSELLE